MKLLLPLFKIKNGIPQEESKWSARFFISAETALGTVQPLHEKKIKIPKELTRAMVSVKVRQTHRPQQKTAIDIFRQMLGSTGFSRQTSTKNDI
jgi:hypothetical protein